MPFTPMVAGPRDVTAQVDLDEAVALFTAHRLSLVRLAILLVDDMQSAEDVVQDAFAGFLGRRRALDDPDKALAYLRTAVVNNARSALRRRRSPLRWESVGAP
jgi:DNA-directed RNA polymerase specialized sigma24 family protein